MTNNEILSSMVANQINLFDGNNEIYLRFLKNSRIARKILFDGYRMLCRFKEITPIEVAPDKAKYWERALLHTDKELSKEETTKYAIGLYLIKTI